MYDMVKNITSGSESKKVFTSFSNGILDEERFAASVYLQRGIYYLQTYFYLIAFTAFLEEQGKSSFSLMNPDAHNLEINC